MSRRELKNIIGEDLKRITGPIKPSKLLTMRYIIINKGFRTVYIYRMRQFHIKAGHAIRRKIWAVFGFLFNKEVEMNPNMEIGSGFCLKHPYGVVIYANKIGNNCTIYQHATLGGNFFKYENEKWVFSGYPDLGDNVTVLTGAVIAGPVKVGSNVVIGANSLVMKDIPDESVVGGNPSQILAKYDKERYQQR